MSEFYKIHALAAFEDIIKVKDRIKNIVKNLKLLSRNESSSTIINSSEDFLSIIENFLSLRLDFKGIEFEVIKSFKEEFKVSFVEISLSQILNNLVTNAIDELQESSPEVKKIWINIITTDDLVLLSVEDSGSGISEENIDKIFDPLFTTKDIGKGTGLGLSISKRLALDMGGDLKYVRSEKTRFELSLKKVNS